MFVFCYKRTSCLPGAVYFSMKNKGLHPVKVVDYVREAYVHPIEDVRHHV